MSCPVAYGNAGIQSTSETSLKRRAVALATARKSKDLF